MSSIRASSCRLPWKRPRRSVSSVSRHSVPPVRRPISARSILTSWSSVTSLVLCAKSCTEPNRSEDSGSPAPYILTANFQRLTVVKFGGWAFHLAAANVCLLHPTELGSRQIDFRFLGQGRTSPECLISSRFALRNASVYDDVMRSRLGPLRH